MFTDVWNNLQMTWRRVFKATLASLPVRSAGEQTKLSWARFVDTYDAVPDACKGFFESILADGQPFPYTILTPSVEGFNRSTSEKLICDLGGEIVVLEKAGKCYGETRFPLEAISYIEFGKVLLASWLRISGVTLARVPISTTIKFNTVTDYLIKPILERIRSVATGEIGPASSLELEKFNRFFFSNYKFMNFAKRSLLGGEKVIQTILQPEIQTGNFRLLGKMFYRTISPAHLTILTDSELIDIRDDAGWNSTAKYGGIWVYIPVKKILSLSQSETGDQLVGLTISLQDGARLDLVFQASAGEEIARLIERFPS